MSLIERIAGVRVLCVGDVMLDRFIGGAVRRISPESPVPVLSVTGTEMFAGGAANVARNVAALGGRCTLVGVVGEDGAGLDLKRLVDATPGVSSAFVAMSERPTTEKTRFVAHGQHMLRADSEHAAPVPQAVEDRLIAAVSSHLAGHDVVVLSDYAKGVLTDRVIAETIARARAAGLAVIVDPKSADLKRYDRATLVTPNASEVLLATGIDPASDEGAVAAGRKILAETGIDAILVTRAERGMTLVSRDAAPLHIASRAREVADVVGAGDTVVATLSLAVGAKAALGEAARIANAAAGIVVGKRGTATPTRSELVEELDGGVRRGLAPPQVKVLTREEAQERRAAWQQDGLKVGFTNGCFDILHVGHLAILDFARAHCDRLVVGVNTDASVKRLKGPERPVNSEADRALLLAALAMVDAVVLFGEDTPQEIIAELQPDVLVKGADYTVAQIVGADIVLTRGGEVLRCELVPGRSTTSTIARLRADTDEPGPETGPETGPLAAAQ